MKHLNVLATFFISLALENAKKNCNLLKVILVQDVCPLKIEIAQFPVGFRIHASLSLTFL